MECDNTSLTPQGASVSVIAPGCIQITESDVRSHHRGPQRAGPRAGGEPQAGERHHGHAGGKQCQDHESWDD